MSVAKEGMYQIYYQATLSNSTLSGEGKAGIAISLNGKILLASQRTVVLSGSTDSQTVGGIVMVNVPSFNSTFEMVNLNDDTTVADAEIDIVYIG